MTVGGPAPVHGGAGGAPEGAGHLAPGHRRQHAGHGGAPAENIYSFIENICINIHNISWKENNVPC